MGLGCYKSSDPIAHFWYLCKAVRAKCQETKIATHLLVNFQEDEQTNVISAKSDFTCNNNSWSFSYMHSEMVWQEDTILATRDEQSMRRKHYGDQNSMNRVNTKSRKRTAKAASPPQVWNQEDHPTRKSQSNPRTLCLPHHFRMVNLSTPSYF